MHGRPPIKGPTMRAKKAPHMEKKGTERPSHDEKAPSPPPPPPPPPKKKVEKRRRKAPTWRKGEQKSPYMVKRAPHMWKNVPKRPPHGEKYLAKRSPI